jgi:NADH oxidase (H2O2-forming)
MEIVIIGLGTAGFAALLAIKKTDRNANITVIDKKKFDLQHSCGLPYALEGKINLEKLEHDIKAEKMNIKTLHECEAIKIDAKKKEIEYVSLKYGKNAKVKYDRALIDTGSSVFFPAIEGLKNNENVFSVAWTSDIKKLENKLKNAKTAAVIGAGAIGLETAYALKKRGLRVTVIEALSGAFPRALDKDMSEILEDYLKNEGIGVLLEQKVKKIEGKKIILDGKEINADIIVCATGVRPNTKLAENSGIKTSKIGIVVDEKMCTSIKDVYAAGDCIEAVNFITGKKFESRLAKAAYMQGTVAGGNIAGKSSAYRGSIATFASVVGEMEIACCGMNSFYAQSEGFEIVAGKSISSDKPEWVNGAEKITLKIIADRKNGKILGCQAIGKNANARINVVSAAIFAKMSLKDLSNVELSYCPAVSQTYDVLQQAIDLAIRKMEK